MRRHRTGNDEERKYEQNTGCIGRYRKECGQKIIYDTYRKRNRKKNADGERGDMAEVQKYGIF